VDSFLPGAIYTTGTKASRDSRISPMIISDFNFIGLFNFLDRKWAEKPPVNGKINK
jgi:hypothetical protein